MPSRLHLSITDEDIRRDDEGYALTPYPAEVFKVNEVISEVVSSIRIRPSPTLLTLKILAFREEASTSFNAVEDMFCNITSVRRKFPPP